MTDTVMDFDGEGWLSGVRRVITPNCDARPPRGEIRLTVIHSISLPPGQFAGNAIEHLFTNQLDAGAHPYFREVAGLTVSAHFLVRRDGALIQFVPITMRAWHAGRSCWRGHLRCNDFSVGIELEGDDTRPFETAQYEKLNLLLSLLAQRFPDMDVAGHCDIAAGRKTDPGPYFDWHRVIATSAE